MRGKLYWIFVLNQGPLLVRVRRVQLHPSILGNGCMHLSIFRPHTTGWPIKIQPYSSNLTCSHDRDFYHESIWDMGHPVHSDFFVQFFLLMAKSCTRQIKSLTRALPCIGISIQINKIFKLAFNHHILYIKLDFLKKEWKFRNLNNTYVSIEVCINLSYPLLYQIRLLANEIKAHGLGNLEINYLRVTRRFGLKDLRANITISTDLKLEGKYNLKVI